MANENMKKWLLNYIVYVEYVGMDIALFSILNTIYPFSIA